MIEVFNSSLAQAVNNAADQANFGKDLRIRPALDEDAVQKIQEADLGGIDYRVKTEPILGYASVFDGLAFDPENLRTQLYALFHKEKVIGQMTIAIAPKPWIEKTRYFEKGKNGVYVRDFRAISGDTSADFLILPGWTVLNSNYRYPKSVIGPGFKAFQNVLSAIERAAPSNTYIEVNAKGKFPTDRQEDLLTLIERGVGAFIPVSEFPCDLNLVGVHYEGSMASVNMAGRIGLIRQLDLGSGRNLGPVFSKRIN